MCEKCGCCNGVGAVYIVMPITGTANFESCSNCNGTGLIFSLGTFVISFKRFDALPPVRYRGTL